MNSTSEIRPAATVIVLRDGADGPEVFMVRRHHAVRFMAGAHVFPGGRVEDSDRSANATWCDGLIGAREKIPGVAPDSAVTFQVAAARELFEEAGVLLAVDESGQYVRLTQPDDHERFKQHRSELNAGRRSFQQVVVGERLHVALDALVHYAHWVTPSLETRRFDTHFFAVRVPPEQSPIHDDFEGVESLWIRPSEAIAAFRRNEIVLPPPTWATIRELQRFDAVDRVLAWARARVAHRREPRLIVDDNGARRLIMPGDRSMPEPDPVAYETRFVLTEGRWIPESFDTKSSTGGLRRNRE